MSHTDYVLTTNGGKHRIHRATCKRATTANALADHPTTTLADASPATCCKPSATKVAEALLGLHNERADAVEEPTEATVPYTDSGAAKHYWRVLCRGSVEQVAERAGVEARPTAHAVTLSGEPDAVDHAVEELRTLWARGVEEFSAWRTSDDEYLALKAADKGVPWGKSTKKPAELAWLADYVATAVAR